jgi:6-pyruvoyltetrahydropterin/6-carboxytetrahydropterin synthase
MLFVTRKVHFNAAHRLHNPEQTEQWNANTFGKCNHANWHGHNYVLEVTVAGMPDPKTGYVVDLGRLKKLLEERILDKCDHRNLNMDVDFLLGVIPSAENLAMAFFEQLEEGVKAIAAEGAFLYSVRLFETERNIAEFNPYLLKNQLETV